MKINYLHHNLFSVLISPSILNIEVIKRTPHT